MTWCLPQDGHAERIVMSQSHVNSRVAIATRISSAPSITDAYQRLRRRNRRQRQRRQRYSS
jgi:hypothetical protein